MDIHPPAHPIRSLRDFGNVYSKQSALNERRLLDTYVKALATMNPQE